MVWICEICKRTFDTKQGLRGHLRVHKGEFVQVSVRIPMVRAKLFKAICRKHGITTCHAIMGFIDALEAADKEGHKILIAANPLVINLHQTFLGKPRSAWKADLSGVMTPIPGCPSCGSRDVHAFKSSYSGLVEGCCSACGASWVVADKNRRRSFNSA